jgi:hypothetical protein
VTRRLLNELGIIIYGLELDSVEKERWKSELFERASRDLKIFMVRNVNKDENIEEMRES